MSCGEVAKHVLPLVVSMTLFSTVFLMSSMQTWFLWNAAAQVLLFVPVVQIPAFLTGHLSYVDIGWPTGLVVLGINTIALADGWWLRRWLCGGCMILHGARMAVMVVPMLYPFKWEQDFYPRYQYAKVLFAKENNGDMSMWPLKVQAETFTQCFANIAILASPVAVLCFNPKPSFEILEVVGLVLWLLCWATEAIADGQKHGFLKAAKEAGDIKTAVLGFAPYDGQAYRLWTMCRHPNYFCEWVSWNAFILMGIPSLLALQDPLWIKIALGVIFAAISRTFYVCLTTWTGAGPAEHFSVQKRPNYREYQRTTRVFFPFEMPWVNHCRVPGWPDSISEGAREVPLASPST